ncbi:polysaccharide biosynthesis/export family protein [Parabacteroides massiliensis]|uniref:polysaccharide biosynthesis/export family protein n=1 Tax=Parabacteroides massiliensis TaxID=1750560 RepID=UPI00096A6C17|nr:polysaccharide biosynthesis/export family protein [Parabacteroides massiliensis]
MRLKYYLFAIFCGLMCACSAPKDVIYFQGIDDLTPEQLTKMSQTYTTKITSDDLLSINVTAWDPAAVTPFNPPVYAYSAQGEQPLVASQSQYTYLVDPKGNINFPVLGEIHVAGLTRQDIAAKLENMISKYVENPLVNVQLLNFKITMMGEISRPGSFTIKNDRISVLDAIGMAGDLPLTANRKNILVIRDNDGVKETYRMDITDPAIFASPGFYLKQNDIVYVEPIKNKQRARTSSDRQFTMSLLTSIISSVSIITSMVITIVNLNRN